jgi:hypothetical protein
MRPFCFWGATATRMPALRILSRGRGPPTLPGQRSWGSQSRTLMRPFCFWAAPRGNAYAGIAHAFAWAGAAHPTRSAVVGVRNRGRSCGRFVFGRRPVPTADTFAWAGAAHPTAVVGCSQSPPLMRPFCFFRRPVPTADTFAWAGAAHPTRSAVVGVRNRGRSCGRFVFGRRPVLTADTFAWAGAAHPTAVVFAIAAAHAAVLFFLGFVVRRVGTPCPRGSMRSAAPCVGQLSTLRYPGCAITAPEFRRHHPVTPPESSPPPACCARVRPGRRSTPPACSRRCPPQSAGSRPPRCR